ncbi:antitoxin TumA [Synechococcus sp. PCC 7336]|uniref:antitoxin TumA n=1 Tax=Synechococcus sp. PCC 7336 TaxID=195250 RepID=UPI00034DB5DC|nr:hypothetical protein [Synechococcus sp. PCC 7336]
MRKQTIQYTSPIDALVAVTKRLSTYENEQKLDSEDFFNRYQQGKLSDDLLFVEWANDYRYYLDIRIENVSDESELEEVYEPHPC